MSTAVLEKVFADWPSLHAGDTETKREITSRETIYRGPVLEHLNSRLPSCYGISRDVAEFIYESISAESRTLETGAGISTLVFALKGSNHTAVTPNVAEVERIRAYAGNNEVCLERVEFVTRSSDEYLPQSGLSNLNFVLIDGKHAFPWPILDWFYVADKLNVGGILLLDDLELASVAILRDFLSEDRHWEKYQSFRRHTMAFKKVEGSVHDVAWHMQPYLTKRYVPESRALMLAKRIGRKSGIRRVLGIRKH
jgi:predicted O-methyltransferase YrrM